MRKKTRVLLITDNHSIHGGGAEKYFFTLKRLLKQTPDIEVFSLGFGPKQVIGDDFVILAGAENKLVRQWWNMFFHPWKYFQLRRWLKKINPDVIHLHNIRKYTIALLKAVRPYRVVQTVHDHGLVCPTMTNIHQDFSICPTGIRFSCLLQHRGNYSLPIYFSMLFSFWRMRRLLRKTVSQYLTPSPWLENYLRINQFEPVNYLPLFVHPEKNHSLQAFKPKHFLYVGRLDKNKGVHVLIDEFAQACEQDKNLILKIAGEGALKKSLQEKVQQLKLTAQIIFLGWQSEAELTVLYDECCALIFPNIGLEAFGLVMTEAMHRGRAIIGSNRGTTAWLVEDKKTGILFDSLKSGDLKNAILNLADDHETAKTYGENGRKKLFSFPPDDVLIKKIINSVYS